MKEDIQKLQADFAELNKKFEALSDYSLIPLEMERALIQRGFVNSRDVDSITAALRAKSVKASGSFYVASTIGGATGSGVLVVDGLVTSSP